MKVILEVQHAVGVAQPRGFGVYSIGLITALLRRKTFDYELTFFDLNGENGNRKRAEDLFGRFDVPLRECTTLSYTDALRDDSVWNKSYNEWTQTNGDVYHFMAPYTVPSNINGKTIVTIHDVIWRWCPAANPPRVVKNLNVAQKHIESIHPFVIADSESARSEILQHIAIPPEKISVIYLAHDEDNIYPDQGDVSEIVQGEYILFVGAVEAKKNIVRIVEAFNHIAEKHRDLKLVLAGKLTADNPQEILGAVNSSPYSERIITPGYVDVAAKRRLLSNALCFVFPSIGEGFGIPILEALVCGCPVICGDNTSQPEVGGDAAIYVNAYDTEQLAYEMERVISSESLRKDMIAKGFVQAKKFSWDKTAEQVENVYRMAAKN
jgi:glycosyltransferase involved in cell wall biosynthesis